jgi:hypothetical protein
MMRKPDHEFSGNQPRSASLAALRLWPWRGLGFRSIYATATRRRDTVSGLITLIGTSKENG